VKRNALLSLFLLALVVFYSAPLSAQTVQVGIGDLSARPGDQVLVPIDISGLSGTEIVSGEVKLTFDPRVLTYSETVRRGGLIENQRWLTADQVVSDSTSQSTYQLVYAAATGFARDGELVFITFKVDSTAAIGSSTVLTVTAASFNNGSPTATLGSGTLSVVNQVVRANFVGRPRSGQVPLEVQYRENSVGDITSYAWSFGDGGTSIEQHPTHIYTTAGTYTVALTVSGPEGSDTETKANYIEVLPDTTAPEITSGPRAINVQRTTATVQWVTNELSNSFVEYSTREDFPTSETATVDELTKNHRVDLEDLTASTRYFYRVRSTDAAGNNSIFKRGFFNTKGRADINPPVIVKGPIAEEVTEESAVVVWLTNEVSTSVVQYATFDDFRNPQTVSSDDLVEEHRVALTGLTADTRYFYRVRSTDAAGNESNFKIGTFKTDQGPDTEAPVILLGPVAIGRTHQSATIKWVANEPVSAVVNYGTGTDYGLSESRDARRRENLIRLTNLEPSTNYHYQVVSTDAAGNVHTSADFEFITRGQPDTRRPKYVLRPFVIGRFLDRLVLRWETDEPCTGIVEYGEDGNFGQIALSNEEGREHTVVLTDLSPNKRYRFRVSITDQSGNGPVASDEEGASTLEVEQPALALLEGPIVAHRGEDRATLRWKTSRPANSFVAYGLDATYGQELNSSELSINHEVVLSGLTAATTYHYQVTSTDPADASASSADLTFSTRALADTLAPIIQRGPEVAGRTDSTAFVVWLNSEPANALVEYGPDLNYGESVFVEDFAREHRVALSGLEPGTTYHYRVSTTDRAGNGPTTSGDMTFATLETRDLQKPAIIAGPGIGELKSDQVTIVWRTDEPSDSFVDYGASTSYGNRAGDSGLTRRHEVTLTGLTAGASYHYRVSSADAAGNTSTTDPTGNDPWSEDLSFRTRASADTQAPVITRGPVIISSNKGALIRFETNERSVGRLAYGTKETLDTPSEEVVYETEATTEHRIRIGHLKARTRYLFRLTVRDGAGNELEIGPPRRRAKIVPVEGADDLSGALEFTTEESEDTFSPVITAGPTLVSRTADSAIIEWSTDEPGDSFVDFGTSALDQIVGDTEYVQAHRVVVTGLSAATTYSYRVRSTDFAGNAATTSQTLSFSTLTEADLAPPAIVGTPALSYVDDTQAILAWNSDEAASVEVLYGTGGALDQVFFSEEFKSAHAVQLTGLQAGTEYSYQVNLTDPSGNGPTTSEVLTFSTAASADITAPVLTAIAVQENDNSAIVTWTTDEPSSGFVFYGETGALGQAAGETEFGTAHQIVLTNLTAGATYNYQVQSIDPTGNSSALSSVATFTTLSAADAQAPTAIAAVDALVGLETAIVRWPQSTSADLASYTLYRKIGVGPFVAVATGLADTNYVDTGLAFGLTYSYYVTATDLNGNESTASPEASGTPSIRNVPGAVSPIGAEVSGSNVTLQVANATPSSSGGALTYTFHVSTSELFSDIVATASGIAPDSPTTSWSFTKELVPGQEYFWRARASDATFDGPWGFPSFFSAPAASNVGDFNNDQIVNFDDFFLFADSFGLSEGQSGYNATLDLSGNAAIDFDDFFQFADVFGVSYAAGRLVAADREVLPATWDVRSELKDGEVVVSLEVQGAQDWRGVGLLLAYDRNALEPVGTEPGVIVGDIASDRRIHSTVDLKSGEVALMAHRMQAVPFTGDGSVVELRFRPLVTAAQTALEVRGGAVQTTDGVFALDAQQLSVRLVPSQFALVQNFPNPFNPETTIAYDLSERAPVRLEIYDILGQRVRVLMDEVQVAGRYQVRWDGRNAQGQGVGSGVYFYRLQAGGFNQVRRMLLLK
jgi:PKD repeat protein/fibronectin type 3 domain-containing protein